jgi:GNAT superfamily N-acetyltransferase
VLLERNQLREVRSQARGRIHALDDARNIGDAANRRYTTDSIASGALTVTFRAITEADTAQLADAVAAAFSLYRDFAPAGWQPPTADSEATRLGRWIADAGFWGEAAFEDATLAGHAAFIPASHHSFRPARNATAAHLLHLFVAPDFWGSGLATELMARANAAAIARGHDSMRLFVSEGQRRARRFYEREGFSAVGEPVEFGLGIPAVEYRRALCRFPTPD